MEVDFSRLDLATRNKVDEILRRDYDLKLLAAIRRQTLIKARNEAQRPRARDGFGEVTLQIDPVIDAHWRQVYGYNYTDSRDLLRFLARRNPEITVRSRGTKIQVGYQAGSQSRRPVGSVVNRWAATPGGLIQVP